MIIQCFVRILVADLMMFDVVVLYIGLIFVPKEGTKETSPQNTNG